MIQRKQDDHELINSTKQSTQQQYEQVSTPITLTTLSKHDLCMTRFTHNIHQECDRYHLFLLTGVDLTNLLMLNFFE